MLIYNGGTIMTYSSIPLYEGREPFVYICFDESDRGL